MVHSSIGSTKTLARAEEAKVAMTAPQEIARNAQSDLAKAKLETEKVEQEVEKLRLPFLSYSPKLIKQQTLLDKKLNKPMNGSLEK